MFNPSFYEIIILRKRHRLQHSEQDNLLIKAVSFRETLRMEAGCDQK